MALLSQSEIDERLKGLDGWEQKDNRISKKFTNKDFVGSLGFVTRVAVLAEKADHHPDILIEYKNVTLTLSTHSEGGLTEKDFKLAGEIEAL
jgi:4a-hydroxytetrahydrobiopterin dehydratase